MARATTEKETMKICYFDRFTGNNSNYLWLKSFRKTGDVLNFDISKLRHSKIRCVKKEMLLFSPTHIHFGGSAKSCRSVPKAFVIWVRQTFPNSRITFFYGDAYYNEYHASIVEYVDKVYTTNKSCLTSSKFEFMICPSDPEVYRPTTQIKKYDLIFIGDNTHLGRKQKIQWIADQYNMDVYGKGWKDVVGQSWKGVLDLSRYSETLTQYKIALSDCSGELCQYTHIEGRCQLKHDDFYQSPRCQNQKCPYFQSLSAYFSNREINTLMCGVMCLTPFKKGMDTIFQNRQHVVWYKDENEMCGLIDHYLEHEIERENIAQQGQEFVLSHYTFEKSARKILGES